MTLFGGVALASDPIRVAVYHTELSRKGPGLLLRDIARGKDEQVRAVLAVIARARPDVLVLRGIDWDFEGRSVAALSASLGEAGLHLPYVFAGQPNRGLPTGFDLNGNGRNDDPDDNHGYAQFTGAEGLAVLSRWPILTEEIQDFSSMLWRDLPGALLPWPGQPDGVEAVLRLSSTNHWLVPIDIPERGSLWVGAFAATTPVFDGPEDRNGRRNHDEIAFWTRLLGGELDVPAPDRLIIAGHANLDPDRGDGRRAAIRALLDHPLLQDPHPPDTLSVDWRRDDLEAMRISYVLPSVAWEVVEAGVLWPAPGSSEAQVIQTASRHHLVWVDVIPR